jgi:hypothetical protein
MKISHCTFITISLELITRNNNKMKKGKLFFIHFHNFEMYDECLRKTMLDLKPAILWDIFIEAWEQSPVRIYPWISIAFCSDNGYPKISMDISDKIF